jgi:hypothetical protein
MFSWFLIGLNWSGSCDVTGLSPSSLYLATVAGVNKYGRAPPSHPPFTFGTRGARIEDAEASKIYLTRRFWPRIARTLFFAHKYAKRSAAIFALYLSMKLYFLFGRSRLRVEKRWEEEQQLPAYSPGSSCWSAFSLTSDHIWIRSRTFCRSSCTYGLVLPHLQRHTVFVPHFCSDISFFSSVALML